MEVLEAICNLGLKPFTGDVAEQVFRMRNGDWATANYQIGDKFEMHDSSSMRGDIVIAPDGKKIWIDQSERQCFREAPNA
jgi:hypothetical protein